MFAPSRELAVLTQASRMLEEAKSLDESKAVPRAGAIDESDFSNRLRPVDPLAPVGPLLQQIAPQETIRQTVGDSIRSGKPFDIMLSRSARNHSGIESR